MVTTSKRSSEFDSLIEQKDFVEPIWSWLKSTAKMFGVTKTRRRSFLPQCIVVTVITLFLSDIGLSVSYPTVLISALTGLNNKTNSNETLRMTAIQASWMGSISYLGKMFGSLACGFASEFFGRRNSIILISIPHLIAFYLFYFSTSIWQVFVASLLLGFGSGYLKAPATTYITEISEVSLRGVLVSITSVAITFGPVIVFLLSNLTAWRNIALYSCILQVIVTNMLCWIPESPLWLLSKKRDEKALKSLRWLRGWVPQEAVQTEFNILKGHKNTINSCKDCKSTGAKCTHIKAQTTRQSIRELIRKRTLKPYFILVVMGTATYFTGTHHLIAFMVQILNAYQSPIDPNWALVIVSCIGLVGTLAGIVGLKVFGKRKLYLVALSGATLSTLMLSIYGFQNLPFNTKSHEQKRMSNESIQASTSHIPLIIFCSMRFFTTITLLIPYSMLGELFSQKARSMATSATTLTNNILTFLAIKSVYNFENWFDLPTTLAIYSAIGVIGFAIVYNILPETEGRTLEEIEIHFADENIAITDHHITRLPRK